MNETLAVTFEEVPWTLIPGLIGFVVGFFIQFRLRYYIDREKVLALKNMADLYPNTIPPKSILNKKGKKLYFLFNVGVVLFVGSIILTIVLEALSE